jgi:hypothetical protein
LVKYQGGKFNSKFNRRGQSPGHNPVVRFKDQEMDGLRQEVNLLRHEVEGISSLKKEFQILQSDLKKQVQSSEGKLDLLLSKLLGNTGAQKSPTMSPGSPTGQCFKCGGTGHFRRDCKGVKQVSPRNGGSPSSKGKLNSQNTYSLPNKYYSPNKYPQHKSRSDLDQNWRDRRGNKSTN